MPSSWVQYHWATGTIKTVTGFCRDLYYLTNEIRGFARQEPYKSRRLVQTGTGDAAAVLQPFDMLLDKSLEADKNLAPAARLESLKDKRMMAIQFFEQKIRDVEFEMGVPPAHAAGAEYVVSSNVCLAELGHALSKGSPSSAKKALGRGLTKMSLRALPRDSNRRAPHRLPRSF
jgi:hypothetical protein